MWRFEGMRRTAFPAEARLFPELDPYAPPGNTEADQRGHLRELAASLVETDLERDDEALDHPTMPAAYAFFAELVEHELSLGALPSAPQCSTLRSPRLDLASLYGTGPEQEYLYDRADPALLLLEAPHGPDGELDLPRNRQGAALVGNPQNDENVIMAQLHQALIRFHNAAVGWVRDRWGARERDGREVYLAARRLVRWHFQWVVVHDLLPRLVGRDLVTQMLPRPGEPAHASTSIYGPTRKFLPVEFLLGAFAGHLSLRRSRYDLNDHVRDRPVLGDGLATACGSDLRGGRTLPAGWTIQWDRFLEIEGSHPQFCRRLDTHLPAWAHDVDDHRGSALENMLARGVCAALPSGQAVARALGLRPVREGHDPLLAYVLAEAEDPPSDGLRLDGVGARIVAEVVVGALASDPDSYLRIDRAWRPEFAPAGRVFDLGELLRFAGVPLTAADLPSAARVGVPVRRLRHPSAALPFSIQETLL